MAGVFFMACSWAVPPFVRQAPENRGMHHFEGEARAFRAHRDPASYVARRATSLIVVPAALAGILAAAAAEAAHLPHAVAAAVGVGTFVASAMVGSGVASGRPTRSDTAQAGRSSRWATQLGPGPERMIGRLTGARG